MANTMKDIRPISAESPMAIDIQTPDIIEMNIKLLNLKPVSNAINFERGDIPTVDGLFSKVVFGETQEERRKTFGYIELNTTILHPKIYETLISLQHNIQNCCSGEGSWEVTESGDLIRIEKESQKYDETKSGLSWFIDNYPRIKFKRNKSKERNEKIDMMKTFSPDEIVMTKWLVQPVFYRDVESKQGPKQIPPINKEYADLIRYAKSLENESIGFVSNAAKINIQNTTLRIYKYFCGIIEKSDGFFKQNVIGKSPDYGHRAVISCAVLNEYDTPADCPVNLMYTGIPLAQICVGLYPFIRRWIINFMANMFETSSNKTLAVVDGKSTIVDLDDPMSMYTQEFVTKQMDKWIDNFESRFDPVKIPIVGGKQKDMVFTGRTYVNDKENPEASSTSNRIFTWTDLLYIAAVECSLDKHEWITRYPVISHLGTFPTRIHVLSTLRTSPQIISINGISKVYKYYPVIDPSITKKEVATSFIDTITMSNLLLDGIGGDYDGDMVSARAPFTTDANEECEEIIHSLKFYLNAQGKLIRVLKNEPYLTLYGLTSESPTSSVVDEKTKQYFVSLKPEELGMKKITELFGRTTDMKTKEIKAPKYKHTDRVHLKAGECSNTTDINTTLGRIVFNKILVEKYITNVVDKGYVNTTLTNKAFGQLASDVERGAKYELLTTDELWAWLSALEFYTFKLVTIFGPSYTYDLLMPDKESIDKRNKFYKDNKNPTTKEAVKMEQELVKTATDKLFDKDDPGIHLYNSGAKGTLADNYKNISTTVGPVLNPMTGEFDIIKSNYVEGFRIDEMPMAGNMVINGTYPKSVGTAVSGYVTKQFYAALANAEVGTDGSDCHTKGFIKVLITESNWALYEFQNIVIGEDKYESLTVDNYNKYLGKIVKMRSPMACTYKDAVCSVCAGKMPYITGLTNVGIQFAKIPNDNVNAGMKKFHVTTVTMDKVNLSTLII